jgi:sialic acid synthase SpsE
MMKISLTNNKIIGDGEEPFIIAEIGNNHNGSLELAFKLIEKAHEIGLDAVKFQVKDIETAFVKELLDKPYLGKNSFGKTYREHKKFLEFSKEQLTKIYNYANDLGLICFSTPFDVKSVEMLEEMKNPIYKISSFHVTDLNLIEQICKTKKPIIMSTGMSTIEEVDSAVELIKKHGNSFALLHCVSCYPTNDDDVNLKVIPFLHSRYNCPIGYSGHERGTAISSAAVTLGACIIERHFTLDRTMKGPDHAASLEIEGMRLIISRSKKIFHALGNSEKKLYDCEIENRKKFRGN